MMSQPSITKFVSTTTVSKQNTSMTTLNDQTKDEASEKVFDSFDKENPNKRPRLCISDSSDHSLCIEKDLEDIKQSMEKIVTKDDMEQMVTNIMGKMFDKIKTEIRKEVKIEIEGKMGQMKDAYDKKLSTASRQMEVIERENINLLEKNAQLHSEVRKMRENIDRVGRMATESVSMANWNEQYSRKKNIKIHFLPETKGENLESDFRNVIKQNANVDIQQADIVAIHRIPGKQGFPRPVIVKFLRMEAKIAVLRKRKELKEKLEIRIGDDITGKNQELLNRLNQHEYITSAWYFNGHVYGTDTNGERYRFNIFDNIHQKLTGKQE